MKRKQFFMTIAAAIFIAGGGFFAASALAERQNKSVVNSENSAVIQVALENGKATPATVTAVVGSTVQFNSRDGKSHVLALGEGSAHGDEHNHTGAFNSGEFGADEAWKVQFNEAGTYFFHDHKNPDINVLVVVYEKS